MRAKLTGRFCALLAAVTLAATCQLANAGITTYGFTNISNNSGQAAAVAPQFKVVITDQAVNLNALFPTVFTNTSENQISTPGAGHLNFVFVNLGSIASAIADVYFDDGTLMGISALSGSSGVSFSSPATPANLPGANSISPAFVTSQNFSANSISPVAQNAINPGEWLAINFELINGKNYDSAIAAMQLGLTDGGNSEALRIGLHVQAIGASDDSDGFINGPPSNAVPEPAALTLTILGGIGTIAVRRRSTPVA